MRYNGVGSTKKRFQRGTIMHTDVKGQCFHVILGLEKNLSLSAPPPSHTHMHAQAPQINIWPRPMIFKAFLKQTAPLNREIRNNASGLLTYLDHNPHIGGKMKQINIYSTSIPPGNETASKRESVKTFS